MSVIQASIEQEKAIKSNVSVWDMFKGVDRRRTILSVAAINTQAASGAMFIIGEFLIPTFVSPFFWGRFHPVFNEEKKEKKKKEKEEKLTVRKKKHKKHTALTSFPLQKWVSRSRIRVYSLV
jgi:hypothetical protein